VIKIIIYLANKQLAQNNENKEKNVEGGLKRENK
jgi:hypothetical protein